MSFGLQAGGGFKKAAAAFVNVASTVHSDLSLSNKSNPSTNRYKVGDKITNGIGAAYYGGVDYKRESYNGQVINTLAAGVFGFGGNLSWNKNGITNWFLGFDPSYKAAFVFGLEANFRKGFSK